MNQKYTSNVLQIDINNIEPMKVYEYECPICKKHKKTAEAAKACAIRDIKTRQEKSAESERKARQQEFSNRVRFESTSFDDLRDRLEQWLTEAAKNKVELSYFEVKKGPHGYYTYAASTDAFTITLKANISNSNLATYFRDYNIQHLACFTYIGVQNDRVILQINIRSFPILFKYYTTLKDIKKANGKNETIIKNAKVSAALKIKTAVSHEQEYIAAAKAQDKELKVLSEAAAAARLQWVEATNACESAGRNNKTALEKLRKKLSEKYAYIKEEALKSVVLIDTSEEHRLQLEDIFTVHPR